MKPFILLLESDDCGGPYYHGICGFCGKGNDAMFMDDYYQNCIWVSTDCCGSYYVLCCDFEVNQNKCSQRLSREDLITYCQENQIDLEKLSADLYQKGGYLAYPLKLEYVIPDEFEEEFEDLDLMRIPNLEKYKSDQYNFDAIDHNIGLVGVCSHCNQRHNSIASGW